MAKEREDREGIRRGKHIDEPDLFDGVKSKGFGNSTKRVTEKRNAESRNILVNALTTELPHGHIEKTNKKAGVHVVPVIKQASLSLRTMINQKIEEGLLKNVGAITEAVDDYMENLKSPEGSKDVKAHFRNTFLTSDALKDMEKSQSRMLAENIDFQQFRVFKRGHEFQQQMMVSKRHHVYCMAGRRSGKTEGNILTTLFTVQNPNHYVMIIGLTHETAMAIYWHPLLGVLEELGAVITEKRSQDGIIRLANGSFIQFMGNSTGDEREKMRGKKWHLVVIDEVQSQKALGYLVTDIIEPMLLDYRGKLFLTGTGPRIRGTLWEALWENDLAALKLNWNLTQNPYIPDHAKVLEKLKSEKGLTDNDPLFVREYLGRIAYDDDALVLRFKEDNFYNDSELQAWVQGQPATDIHFIGGLDYGFTDSDAFIIFCYSDQSPMVWALYQYKMARQGINELATGIRNGIEFVVSHPFFHHIPTDQKRQFYIFGDTSDNRASSDLSVMLGLNIFPAYKHDKTAAIDFLQDDCRRGWLRIPKIAGDMTPLEDEGMKTIFGRDEKDNLTREIDDDAYHPDMIPATMYALRSGPWAFRDSRG